MRSMTFIAALLACTASIAWASTSPTVRTGGGTLVVLNKAEASCSIFDVETHAEIATLEVGVGPHEAATSPDGRTVVVCDYGQQMPGRTLTVIDLASLKVVRTIDLGKPMRPHGIVFMPDGQRVVVTAEQQQALLIVNVASGEIEREIKTDQRGSHMLAITPDASRAFVTNLGSGTVTVIDLESGEVLGQIATGAGAEGIDVSPDGLEVWVTNREADSVSVIDTVSLEIVASIETGDFPIRVKITPDGERALVSCARSGEVQVFDTATKRLIKVIAMTGPADEGDEQTATSEADPVPVGILITPDGRVAYIANTNTDTLTVIDLEALEVSGRVQTRDEPDGMAWSGLDRGD